ncbi:MAG: hypothetical protein P1U87_06900 [Verrucomicrobiales bacterium]|nr:hypothetical protein [Verrucomicrobiales bacterium]
MSSSTPPIGSVAPSRDPEEVLKLSCPVCSGGLNLRRKHVGIEGKCVQCKTSVTARDVDGIVTLVRTDLPAAPPLADRALASSAAEASSSSQVAPASPVVNPEIADIPPTGAASPAPEMRAEPSFSSVAPVMEAAPLPALEVPQAPPTSDAPKEENGPSWGFPGREEDPASPVAAVNSPPELEEEPSDALSSFMASIPAGKLPAGPAQDTSPGEPDSSSGLSAQVAPADSPPSKEFGGGSSFFDSSSVPNPNLQPDSAAKPPVEKPGEDEKATTELPSKAEERGSGFSNKPISLENDAPLSNISSALFGQAGSSVADEPSGGSENRAEMNPSWGTKVPTQNHASISPFTNNKPENSAGFAETLFREKASDVPPATFEPKSPFGDSADSAGGVGGGLFASAVQEASAKPREEVVLDGDGRPLKPMSDEEKDAFARESMQVGGCHKRPPWVTHITRFVLTIAILCGVGYGAYVFTPEEKIKEWKNMALDWLEPGTVLLDFLPFEIRDVEGGEEGEKEFKIKAIDGLNNLTDDMDAYLDASEANLEETGVAIPDREEQEKMDMPNIPKLPFSLPGVNPGGAETESAAPEAE